MKIIRQQLCVLMMLGLILGIYRGYIALWRDGAAEPCRVYPYKAALLPPQEETRLAEGIPIQDEEHLYDLLMNYLS